jgi:LytR cell envelope-related transcriptional attenuator
MTAMASARGRGSSDNILRTAARGAALIGLAVVIGIVLLQVVDNGSGGSGVTPPTAAGGSSGGTTSTTAADTGRPAQQVTVFVQNGSGLANAAATKANELRGLGYAIAGTGNAAVQQGSTVACASGYDKEGAALSQVIGAGTTVATFPSTPPADAATANCIVTIGQG